MKSAQIWECCVKEECEGEEKETDGAADRVDHSQPLVQVAKVDVVFAA